MRRVTLARVPDREQWRWGVSRWPLCYRVSLGPVELELWRGGA